METRRLDTIVSHVAPVKGMLQLSPEVEAALAEGRPVVALESTIISHGMPYPQNVETAKRVESVVRSNGAVPATIAILKGVVKIGLVPAELEELGKLGLKAIKCSRRDIAHVIARKENGAATVSATMLLANMAGIDVFVTGGIGGVHRGGERSMDISADLTELGKTRVTVVSAGVKSILDIPRTLEFLETQGVPVITLGATEFPAFFTRNSGCPSPMTSESPEECAKVAYMQRRLGLQTGMIVAVPIPEAEEAKASVVNRATAQALREADEQSIAGKDITPFLLKRINEISKGQSLASNIALVLNNARVGSQIACALASLRKAE